MTSDVKLSRGCWMCVARDRGSFASACQLDSSGLRASARFEAARPRIIVEGRGYQNQLRPWCVCLPVVVCFRPHVNKRRPLQGSCTQVRTCPLTPTRSVAGGTNAGLISRDRSSIGSHGRLSGHGVRAAVSARCLIRAKAGACAGGSLVTGALPIRTYLGRYLVG